MPDLVDKYGIIEAQKEQFDKDTTSYQPLHQLIHFPLTNTLFLVEGGVEVEVRGSD